MKRREIVLSGEGGYCQTAAVRFEVGQCIDALPDYAARFGHRDFLDALERYRPAGMLGHHNGVVMHASPDDLDNSGGGEWLHELQPLPGAALQRHDAAWANQLATLLADEASCCDERLIRVAADKYWRGEASDDPQWEYLAARVIVVAVQDY